MLDSLRKQSVTEPTERSQEISVLEIRPISRTTFFRIGRVVYGGILALMGVDGIMNWEERAQYAEAKNIPRPKIANIGSHALLLAGGLGISLWRAPKLAASAITAFFLGVTPTMHDFWSVDDSEQKQQEMVNFLKNMALLGTGLLLLAVARREE